MRVLRWLLNFNVVAAKSKFFTSHLQAQGNLYFDWAWSIGVAHPSWKYFPAAWTIVTLEKQTGDKVRLHCDRWRVGEEFDDC